jgi:hypothetical protein
MYFYTFQANNIVHQMMLDDLGIPFAEQKTSS